MKASMLWVLGAPTIHMQLIEKLLRQCGQEVVFAKRNGIRLLDSPCVSYDKRVYKASRLKLPRGGTFTAMNFVECQVVGKYPDLNCFTCDHNRPTSVDHTHAPSEMLQRSSMGQVLIWLSNIAGDNAERPPFDWPQLKAPYLENGQENHERSGLIGTALSGGELLCRGRWLRIPDELRFAAAISYDRFAAHRGDYPGIKPVKLQAWYLLARTKHLGCESPGIMYLQKKARRKLRSAAKEEKIFAVSSSGRSIIEGAAALRCDDPVMMVGAHVPELEATAAAARCSICYMAAMDERHVRVVLRAQPHTVACWMKLQSKKGFAVQGNPARGVAHFRLKVP
jgi:hypothetical protein